MQPGVNLSVDKTHSTNGKVIGIWRVTVLRVGGRPEPAIHADRVVAARQYMT